MILSTKLFESGIIFHSSISRIANEKQNLSKRNMAVIIKNELKTTKV